MQSDGDKHVGRVSIASGQRVTLTTGRVGWWALGGDGNPCIARGSKDMSIFHIDFNWGDRLTTTLGNTGTINIGIPSGNDTATILENNEGGTVTINYIFMCAY